MAAHKALFIKVKDIAFRMDVDENNIIIFIPPGISEVWKHKSLDHFLDSVQPEIVEALQD